jgi:hypothetical protein
MRSFLLASFAFLTLVVVGCDPATETKPPEPPKIEAPKVEAPKVDAPKDKMEPVPVPETPKVDAPKTETPK